MSHECENCGQSLEGSDYTLPWEDGDNSAGYWTCRHCGAINWDWASDEDDD